MVLLSFQRILVAVVLSAVTNVFNVVAAPPSAADWKRMDDEACEIATPEWKRLDHEAREILARATPAAPHWVVYSDEYTSGITGPPAPSAITVSIALLSVSKFVADKALSQGFNVFALSFLLIEGAWDKAEEWASLTAAQRSSIKSQYAAAGIKLIVSVFGSTDVPTTTGADPVGTANTMAAWVKQYDLDGIDVDYEVRLLQVGDNADLADRASSRISMLLMLVLAPQRTG